MRNLLKLTNFDTRNREAIKGKELSIKKNSIVVVSLKAFFSFTNFSLTSTETC